MATQEEMQAAAVIAGEELLANFRDWTALELIAWFAGNYMKAGHKKLGRLLVGINKGLAQAEDEDLKRQDEAESLLD